METTTLKMFTETVHEENNLIWIKPLCDFFNISLQNQQRKLKNDPIFSKLWIKKSTDLEETANLNGKKSTDFGEIDLNGRILLTKKGFIRWIQTLNPNIIDLNLQQQFIQYQEKVSDYLFGTMEEHEAISATMKKLNDLKKLYSEVGNDIRTTQKELQELLNQRYQYRLPFKEARQLE